jgi:hypothetical protein
MVTSEQINEIAKALSEAQGEIQNVVKDAKNPHFKSDYATLDAVTDTVRPVFSKHGLAVVQMPTFSVSDDGGSSVVVETLITHSSGQWIRGTSASPIQKADPQGVGSATTYLRRYSLAAVAAIAQTDDDGNHASQGNGKPQAAKAEGPVKPNGYDGWRTLLAPAAKQGKDALKKAWEAGTPAYRSYLNATEPDGLDKLKAEAEKAVAA